MFEAYYAESLLPELCIDSCDDFGAERPELAAVVKYGTWTDVSGACFDSSKWALSYIKTTLLDFLMTLRDAKMFKVLVISSPDSIDMEDRPILVVRSCESFEGSSNEGFWRFEKKPTTLKCIQPQISFTIDMGERFRQDRKMCNTEAWVVLGCHPRHPQTKMCTQRLGMCASRPRCVQNRFKDGFERKAF